MKVFVLTTQETKQNLENIKERLMKGGIYKFEIIDSFEYSNLTKTHIRKIGNGDDMNENDEKDETIYLSNLYVMSNCIANNINECLIIRDDIDFSYNIIEAFKDMPKDSVITCFKTKRQNDFSIDEDILDFDFSKCYYLNDILKVFHYITSQQPKKINQLLLKTIREYPSYLVY